MASTTHHYPDYLNPFGGDEEENSVGLEMKRTTNTSNYDDYPKYLSPFGDDDGIESIAKVDDYDNSLNPFGDDEENKLKPAIIKGDSAVLNIDEILDQHGEGGNPFEEDDDIEQQDKNSTNILLKSCTPQPGSLELPPPVPLPRTKSLLKKEQAQKNKQQHQLVTDSNQTTSLLSNTSSNSSSPITTTTCTTATTTTGSFQRKKNKRNAPPVPINFKRQVSGSLDAIEEELNDIGDQLAEIESESNLCQSSLTATYQVDEAEFTITRFKFIELIKRKNSILRRQKELMYRKRELKLDQIHSDIEYELRMIGNKQLSHRTSEDENREKDLLKKLVEIVEEKSDIVENLNKDTSCDSHDIGEAFRRLNITIDPPYKSDMKDVKNPSNVSIKNENCDRSSIAIGNKLSKIATLLPKSGTLKGTIKIKRKRLFKKCDSRPIER